MNNPNSLCHLLCDKESNDASFAPSPAPNILFLHALWRNVENAAEISLLVLLSMLLSLHIHFLQLLSLLVGHLIHAATLTAYERYLVYPLLTFLAPHCHWRQFVWVFVFHHPHETGCGSQKFRSNCSTESIVPYGRCNMWLSRPSSEKVQVQRGTERVQRALRSDNGRRSKIGAATSSAVRGSPGLKLKPIVL